MKSQAIEQNVRQLKEGIYGVVAWFGSQTLVASSHHRPHPWVGFPEPLGDSLKPTDLGPLKYLESAAHVQRDGFSKFSVTFSGGRYFHRKE